jgi:hypothetical protein
MDIAHFINPTTIEYQSCGEKLSKYLSNFKLTGSNIKDEIVVLCIIKISDWARR